MVDNLQETAATNKRKFLPAIAGMAYNTFMKTFLSDEQRRALGQQPNGIEVECQETQKVYILTDAEMHRRGMQALQKQEDHDAIQAAIGDMEAGRVVPYEEVRRQLQTHLREKYGLPLSDT